MTQSSVKRTVIGFGFHYIDTRGLFSKYKLHTSAEDLTKNRASRKDVIKFALIQQAAQCTLGYLMADDTELFVSPQYATVLWAQRLRHIELTVTQWIPYISRFWPGSAYELKGPGDISPSVFWQDTLGHSLRNTTQGLDISRMDPAPFTSQEMIFAKAMYWVLVPLFQYIATMVLVDTFHHQTWGMKYNFSVYGAFWDWVMGTSWNPYDSRAQAKYQRGKANAEVVAAKAKKAQAQESQPAVGTSTCLSLQD
ncbi:MAG: hypothetical protein Q9168_006588 [Polycauliona sp. 1 TL-2023]